MESNLCFNSMRLKSLLLKNFSPFLGVKSLQAARFFFENYSRFQYSGVSCTLIDIFNNFPMGDIDTISYNPILHLSFNINNDDIITRYILMIHVYKLLGITVFTLYENEIHNKKIEGIPVTSFLIDHTELLYIKAKRFNNS